MLSVLRKGLVYKDISPDILEHDIDLDADLWQYDDKDVYRGSFDPRYTTEGLNVYWLYDDNLKRIGLAEHDSEDPTIFKALWFYDNSFATLTQDTNWKSTGKTLWSKLSNEAYQSCLEDDFSTVRERALNSGVLLITPKFLIDPPQIYMCEKCGKKEFRTGHCQVPLDVSNFSALFVDDDFVLYERVTPPPCDAYAPVQSVEQELQTDPPESKDVQSPVEESPPLQPDSQSPAALQ